MIDAGWADPGVTVSAAEQSGSEPMQFGTMATLKQLIDVDWFRNVGAPDPGDVEILSSWAEAIEYCTSVECQRLNLEAVNQYRTRLAERSSTALDRWSDIVAELYPIVQGMVRDKAGHVVAVSRLPQIFIDIVDWDMLHLCMECEYADIFPVGLYVSKAYWYVEGHFQCGWQGPFPKGGRSIIY
jgi:hypothetical protein